MTDPFYGVWPSTANAGPQGPAGPAGVAGPQGERGNAILTTSGPPLDSVGDDGDYAYDPSTATIYGPKQSGSWPMPGTELRNVIAAQRIQHVNEVTVSSNEGDPGGGWGDVIPFVFADPLVAGPYQVIAGLEISLMANAIAHTAQAQLLIDGAEVALWSNPRAAYNRVEFSTAYVFPSGDTPSFQLRLRRFGPGAGTARARRAQVLILPCPVLVEL